MLPSPPTPTPQAVAGQAWVLTKQLSMEQETRAVRLMVAGCLGQRTCPRSRCAARQPWAPAASLLWGPPGTAPARSERPGARTQPLLPRASPLLSTMERARLRPPARAQKGGEPSDRSALDTAGEVEAERLAGPRPPLAPPAAPRRPWGRPPLGILGTF